MSSPIMAGNAGLVNEDRRRIVFLDDFLDRFVEPLLAAEHDVVFVHVGGEAGPVQLRAGGLCAAVVPGVSLAGDGSVHEVGDVGDGLQRDLRAVEGAAAGSRAGLRAAWCSPFLRSFSDFAWFLSQPGSLKTSWILLASVLITDLLAFAEVRARADR